MRSLLVLPLLLMTGCSAAFDGGAASSSPNAAELVASSLPAAELTCGDRRTLSLTFLNTGTTTWTSADGFELRTVAQPEAVTEDRFGLAEDAVIAPGGEATFEIAIRAPATAGLHTTEWRMANASGAFGIAAEWIVTIDCNRTPDPAEGEALPLPYMSDLIEQIADEDPTLVAESCQDTGGNWRFLDTVVDRLRKIDTRWDYNWKRGVVGDPSRDVVDYHYGAGADEDSEQVYIIDMLVDHCGTNPHPGWNDVTQATLDGGTIGVWTGRERF